MRIHFLFIRCKISLFPPSSQMCLFHLTLHYGKKKKMLCVCFTSLPFWFTCKSSAPNETRQRPTATFRNCCQAGCQWSMLVAKVERKAAMISLFPLGAWKLLDNHLYISYITLTSESHKVTFFWVWTASPNLPVYSRRGILNFTDPFISCCKIALDALIGQTWILLSYFPKWAYNFWRFVLTFSEVDCFLML